MSHMMKHGLGDCPPECYKQPDAAVRQIDDPPGADLYAEMMRKQVDLQRQITTLKQALKDLVNRRADVAPDSVIGAFQMLEADWNEERAKIKAVLKVVDYLVDREACLLQWRDDTPWPRHERRSNFEDRATEVRQAAKKIRAAVGEA